MTDPAAGYRLSNVLLGHTGDVRGVAVTLDGSLLSASRDKTAKLWTLDSFHPMAARTYKGHTNYVSCVCAMPPNEAYPEGLVLSGSNDHTICAFHPVTEDLLFKLEGHTNVVCCMNVTSDGRLISASWDSTARVWTGQTESLKLEGHTASVWSVIELPDSKLLVTASADKSIKVWEGSTCQQTLNGHEDCVRGLAGVSPNEFLSCANDATVRMWTVNGDCLGVFYGHSNFIYSIVLLPDKSGFVTSAEDSSVRVWNSDGECQQVIQFQCQSIWAVTALPNGDVATGCSDSVVRVFSKDPARQADSDELAKFDEEVANFGKSKNDDLGEIKVNDLPTMAALLAPGSRDGQTKLIREGGEVICYSWSAEQNQWIKIGPVVGAKKPTEGRSMFEGQEYDFVFSVDVEEGKPPLNLPFNKTDDPYTAAQAFIHKHNLSQYYLDTIATFIIKNAGMENLAPAPQGTFIDPFTGGNRYVPNSSTATGPTSANPDPFTGGSSYTSAAAKKEVADTAAAPTSQVQYHLFEQGKVEVIANKILEFNQASAVPYNDEKINKVVALHNPTVSADEDSIRSLQLLLTWDKEKLFPVLDLLRLALRNKAVNDSICSGPFAEIFIENVLRSCLTNQAPELTRLTALRVVTNMVGLPAGEKLAQDNAEFLLNCATQLTLPKDNPNPRQQVAVATVLFNFSVAYLRGQADLQKIVFPLALTILPRLSDMEAKNRMLRTISNFLSKSNPAMFSQAADKKLADELAILIAEPKTSEVASHLLSILP
ncbi:phospholipase A-2-activating protein [Neocloeon triangulifer]|uniref:phospholipase A-2-activating protein n=1 Tax=Neocloeon triangulifer TaxID=2078957 RepID=UPI00286F6A66|nr:phospholipase A-2-activating protein [Neocloeon triangulifer]